MKDTMLAARLHALHQPMTIDTIPVPKPRPSDVLVEVKACGIVPNMANVINNWPTWFPHQPLPKFPAIFGLDATGVVAEVGEAVLNVRRGDRVYVSPLRSCGSCRACRAGNRSHCQYFTLNGYFSTSRDGQRIFDLYPYGGFSQYMTAPEYALVNLPGNMTHEQAGRPRAGEARAEQYPKKSIIKYNFGKRGDLPPITMIWYDGGNRPPAELAPGVEMKASGSLVIGDKGFIHSADDG